MNESIDYDGDEEIKEYLADQDVKQNEEKVWRYWWTARKRLSPVVNHTLVGFIISALVPCRVRPRQIEHDQLPGFTRSAAHKKQKWGPKVPEIRMLAQLLIRLSKWCKTEEWPSDYRKHEE